MSAMPIKERETVSVGTEGSSYSCGVCGAEVKIVRKPVQDPKCPTLLCCGKPMTLTRPLTIEAIDEVVAGRYGSFAASGGFREECCGGRTDDSGYAVDLGLYGEADLGLVPELALDLSRGCGNPTSFAELQPGETVVDFGCGGGVDVILAAHKVGTEGRVIGLDFAPEMIERAGQSIAKAGLQDHQIDLAVANLTSTGLPDASVDVVISNCVMNLCPDKEAVYQEAFRILRAGGRLAISDIIFTESIEPDLQARFQANWTGCMAGAMPEHEYLELVHHTGFTVPDVVACHLLSPEALDAMASCPGPQFTEVPAVADMAAIADKLASVKFTANK